jgi:hypothetical protein
VIAQHYDRPVLKRWLALSGGWRAWLGALTVLVITVLLVILDISVGPVHRYWSRHSFTSSVLSGLLVLLLTVLIVDRVIRIRQFRNQSRAIAAQAAVVLAQAVRARDAIKRASPADDDREEASGELRTYTLMLLISTPVLIDAKVPRTFLESAQRLAVQLSRALRPSGDEQAREATERMDDGVVQLRGAAAPLLQALTADERAAAVSSNEAD